MVSVTMMAYNTGMSSSITTGGDEQHGH